MISDRSWIAGSAKAAVVVSTRTSKPSAFSQPRIIEAQRSGSCPGQPPHTIIALRMFLSLVDLSGFTPGRQHRRPLDAALDLDASPLVGRDLERLHHLQHVESERAAGTMRPVVQDRGGHVRDANGTELAIDMTVGQRHRLPVAAGLGDLYFAAEAVRVRHEHAALVAIALDWRVPVLGDIKAHRDRDDRP